MWLGKIEGILFGLLCRNYIFFKNLFQLLLVYFYRNAWALLGDMTQEEAMLKFVEKVSELMQHLKPYLEALKKERDAQLIKE